MSVRSELESLVRLAPEVDTTALSEANLDLLLDKGTIDLALKGRALPRNEKVNTVASQREYVLSGGSSVLSQNDFLAIDMIEGGVLYYDGTNWHGRLDGFEPKTREWLDENYPGWRTASASSSPPNYYYIGTGEDNSNNLVVGLVDKPSASTTDGLWVHYLSRGKLMTDDTHYPWTGTTTQLVHLEPYEVLLVYYVLEWYCRLIGKNDTDADRYKLLYETGAAAMARRMPLTDHLLKEGFAAPPYFQRWGSWGKGRH